MAIIIYYIMRRDNVHINNMKKMLKTKKELIDDLKKARRQAARLKKSLDKHKTSDETRMLFTLMSNLPGMVYRCRNDDKRTMEFVSGGCLGLTGHTFSDLFHNRRISYAQLIYPSDKEPLRKEIEMAIRKRRPYNFIYRIKTAKGKVKWVWEQGRTIFAVGGKPLILEGIITDITERKKMEEELKVAFDRLKTAQDQLIQSEKMGAIGRLASGIAHEVKNPLATILQGIDYLYKKTQTDNATAHQTLGRMSNAVKRADNIIRSLLDFSSVSMMKKKSENLNAIIESSLLLVKNDIDRYHIKVIKDLRSDIPKVNLDKNRIEQVFINLFTNAIQAMPDGGELKIRTDIIGQGKEKELIVEVDDVGTGIPKHILDKVFEPFFTTRQAIGGAGLGLSIVRNIVEMHGGKVDIRDKEGGRGTKATVVLKV